jgi:hypothetical protein
MKRRAVLALLTGTALAWPRRAPAQGAAKPVIGFLSSGAASGYVVQQLGRQLRQPIELPAAQRCSTATLRPST